LTFRESRFISLYPADNPDSIVLTHVVTQEYFVTDGLPARIDDLTCCRAVFASWVFLYHLNLQLFSASPFGPAEFFVRRGYLGVDGFFILSGLILAHVHPHLGLSWPDVRGFWARRLLRIYPVHLAVIFLLLLLLAAGVSAGLTPRDPARFGVDELLRNLLLVHGWGLSDRWAWNYPSWSISTEWAGYLAFPLLWAAMRRLSAVQAAMLLPVLLAALVAAEWGGGGMRLNMAYSGALGRFFPEFLAGMALSRAAPLLGGLVTGKIFLAVVAAWTMAATFGPSDAVVVAGLFLVLAGLFLNARSGGSPVLARLPGLIFLGTISYAFYMSFAAVEMAQAVLWRQLATAPADHPLFFSLLTTALTLALAVLLWRGVERPAQRHLGKRIHLAEAPSGR
jgi:peptidoglycan/LPS O-acetylase OafA/YrhL